MQREVGHTGGAGHYTPFPPSFVSVGGVALGDGWPNLPRKCQPKTSLPSEEIKDFAVFSVRQPDISGFVPRMAIYWE